MKRQPRIDNLHRPNSVRFHALFLLFPFLVTIALAVGKPQGPPVTVAVYEEIEGLDTLTSSASNGVAENLRLLLFDSLIRKNDVLDYEGELARKFWWSSDGKTLTLLLRENIKFHNGKNLSSADVKYTFDELLKNNGYKAASLYEFTKSKRIARIQALETPDAETVVFRLRATYSKDLFLSILTTIPIIPVGTAGQQNKSPIGSGPFKFLQLDVAGHVLELVRNENYWNGVPKIERLVFQSLLTSDDLGKSLRNGSIDIAPFPRYLSPEELFQLAQTSNLQLKQRDGTNIQYLVFNTRASWLIRQKIREAIALAIDKEKIIKDVLLGQATIAYSILPKASWAYVSGNSHGYDPSRAKRLLRASGYKRENITLVIPAGNQTVAQYSLAIRQMLKDVGLNLTIESAEPNRLRLRLLQGKFQISAGMWIGGNQEAIFLRDVFSSSKTPDKGFNCCNRAFYKNPMVDMIIDQAASESERKKAKILYSQAWEIVSHDIPVLPLWYTKNSIIANKRIENIMLNAAGDWRFLKDVTVRVQSVR